MSFSVFLLLAWSQYCTAYDAVVFSSSPLKKITVQELVTASPKLLAIGVQGFSLPKFSMYAKAYSAQSSNGPFTSLIHTFSNAKALPMEDPLKIRGGTNGVVYLQANNLEDLQHLLAQNKDLNNYRAVIISSEDAFESELVRHKRVSSDVTFDEEPAADEPLRQGNTQRLAASNAVNFSMPVVLPPVNITNGVTSLTANDLCLLYVEGFNIIIVNGGEASYLTVNSDGKNTFVWDSSYYNCSVNNSTQGTASFVIDVILGSEVSSGGTNAFSLPSGTRIQLRLDFTGVQNNGYWYLNKVQLLQPLTIAGSTQLTVQAGASTNNITIESVSRFSFACSKTQPAFFSTGDSSYVVGISMENFEVDLGLTNRRAVFGYYVTDCVGTFSAGSWMGIIVAVVFASILLFGYLMVQSIQTMDRFDDPKQKQIVINFKE